jgi:basic membrane protein A and related proteins
VKRNTWMTLALAALVSVLAVAIAAVAGIGRAAPAKPQANVKVAVVTDIGGLNDKGFNHLAYVGLQRAKAKLSGVDTRVYITNTASERKPNLAAAAQAGYGLVFGTGFLMFDSIGSVAKAFPTRKFAGIDVPVEAVPENSGANLPNLRGIQFKEQEAGYLVGYIAGLQIKRHPYKGKQRVAAVGANKVPAIVHFLAGFRAGAKKANKKVTVDLVYANDPTFADQAKCKETTLNEIAKGAGVVFEAAGQCGLGGLSAAKQKRVWGIGVDADQSFLGPHILPRATKKVEVAVYKSIQAYKANPSGFKGGRDITFNVKNGGVGYGKLSSKLSKADRLFLTTKVKAIQKLIAQGKIVPPTS